VTTISRAVLLLGFERVRSVASGLVLFEHLQTQAKTPALVETLNMSFYSAVLGRPIAEGTRLVDAEEAFISALFHHLGRILAALYCPMKWPSSTPRAIPTLLHLKCSACRTRRWAPRLPRRSIFRRSWR
jgi:hypothetical protein